MHNNMYVEMGIRLIIDIYSLANRKRQQRKISVIYVCEINM